MVREVRPLVEQHRGVSFETFEPLEVKTQVVAGTNYFIKVKASAAGLFPSRSMRMCVVSLKLEQPWIQQVPKRATSC